MHEPNTNKIGKIIDTKIFKEYVIKILTVKS